MFPTQCTCNAWRTRVETTTIKGLRNSIISLEYCRRKRRSKMPRLSAADRNIAIGRLEAGESQSAVARHFNVHHSTINGIGIRSSIRQTTAPEVDAQEWPILLRTGSSGCTICVTALLQPQLLLDKCLVSEEFRTKPSETVWEKLEFAHIARSLDRFCDHNIDNDVSNGATQYGGGTWWTGDAFGSAMNRVSCLNGVMEGNVFIDVDVNVLRPTAFAKWTDTAEEVSWYGERCPTTADQSWWWFRAISRQTATSIKFCDPTSFQFWIARGRFFNTTTLDHTQLVQHVTTSPIRTSMSFLGHPNRLIWTPLNMSSIDASVTVSNHLSRLHN